METVSKRQAIIGVQIQANIFLYLKLYFLGRSSNSLKKKCSDKTYLRSNYNPEAIFNLFKTIR